MRITAILSTLVAASLAVPLTASDAAWVPTNDTRAECVENPDKYISLYVGPEDGKSILKHACKVMMPPCAYKEDLSPDTVCTNTMDYKIDPAKYAVLNATVEEMGTGNKLSGYAVKFNVTLPDDYASPNSPGAFWTRADCEGYFNQTLQEAQPKGCMIEGSGPGPGLLVIGGTSSLKDVILGVSFVERD